MKKGLWPITMGVLLLLYQVFYISGGFFEGIYFVDFPPFFEIKTDVTWIYYPALYFIGAFSIFLLIWGFSALIKDCPESADTNRFFTSYRALKDTRTLVQCSALVALYVVLDMLQIKLPYLEFTFAFIALAGIAYIAGPVTGFFCGGICEILGYLMAPKTGPLHLGITFTAMLTGFVMGLFLYRREISIVNIIISRCIVAFVFNLGLNTYWISTLIGKGYIALLPMRALKAALELPIDIALIFLALNLIKKINGPLAPVKNKQKKKKKQK